MVAVGRLVSCHVTPVVLSCLVLSCLVASFHVLLCLLASYHVTSSSVTSSRAAFRRVMSCLYTVVVSCLGAGPLTLFR